MTKTEIIEDLYNLGNFHPDMTNWKKCQLEKYLEDCKIAETLSYDELLAKIARK